MIFETVCQSEYQDVYRIKSYVILVVNKFQAVFNENNRPLTLNIYTRTSKRIYKKYADGSKDLQVLKVDYKDFNDYTIPKGTVIYHGTAVKSTTDMDKWNFQIKTSGEAFSGDKETVTKYLETIQQIIDGYIEPHKI